MSFSFSSVGLDVTKPASDLAQEDTGGSFEPMPTHQNQLMVTNMEYNDIAQSNPTGGSAAANFTLEISVVGDQYNGRKIWQKYWVKKRDGSGNKVAQYQLNAIADAVGFVGILDNPFDIMSCQKPFEATIYIEKNNDPQYKDFNQIKNPKKIGTTAPASGGMAQQSATQQAAPQQGFAPPQNSFAPQQQSPQQSTFNPQAGGMPNFAQQQ